MESLGKMFPEAHKDWVEVRHQVYLIAQARLIEFQKEWEGEDEDKEMDFTTAPYWLQFSVNDPVPVHDLEDFWGYLGGDE